MSRRGSLVRGALGLVAIVLLLAVMFFWERDSRDEAMTRSIAALPANQAIVACLDVGRLRETAQFADLFGGRFDEHSTLGFASRQVRLLAFSVGDSAVYAVAHGDFPERVLRSSLERRGADCAGRIDREPCGVPVPGGQLSVKLLDRRMLAIANGASANELGTGATTESDAFGTRARQALDSQGAVLWAAIEPRALDRVMRDPPEGWINLSLIARALHQAETADVVVKTSGAESEEVELSLEAKCKNQEDAAELGSVLEGLNRFALAAIESGKGESSSLWATVVRSFAIERNGDNTRVSWRLSLEALSVLAGQ